MKTLDELRNEVMANEELKKAFAEAFLNGTVTEFIVAQGVEATPAEITAVLDEFAAQTSDAIPDEDMATVAGGRRSERRCPKCNGEKTYEMWKPSGFYLCCADCKEWFKLL